MRSTVEADGDYVVTVRHMDGVFRIDHATGNVEWTLGTPPARNLDRQDRPHRN